MKVDNRLDKYAEKLVRKTKFSHLEKQDLKKELLEHLINSKEESLKKGLSEEDSINIAINKFNKLDFIEEMNKFTLNKKAIGIKGKYIIKINIILIFIYSIFISFLFSLFSKKQDLMISYFLIIGLVLFVNYYYSANHFQFKKDIVLNTAISCIVFFLIEKFEIIILSKIYSSLSNDLKIYNILSSFPFKTESIVIYMILSIFFVFIALYSNNNFRNIKFRFLNSTIEKVILVLSLITEIIYFLYPNRLYFLNLTISKLLNLNVERFEKNLLYMIINDKIIIVNIGFILIIILILYKLYLNIIKKTMQNSHD